MANDRTDPWHVMHTVEGQAGVNGYQINGPASFLIFGDEVDDLIALLHGVKVDDAIRRLGEMDEGVGQPVQGTIPGTLISPELDAALNTLPHTRYITGEDA